MPSRVGGWTGGKFLVVSLMAFNMFSHFSTHYLYYYDAFHLRHVPQTLGVTVLQRA